MVPISETGRTENHNVEQVFYNIHHRVSILYLRHTSSTVRSFLEFFWMLLAVSGFAALICLHLAFVYRGNPTVTTTIRNITHHPLRSIPSTCLPSVPGFRADANLTHLVLLEDKTENSFAWEICSSSSMAGNEATKVCSASTSTSTSTSESDSDVCDHQTSRFPTSLRGQVYFSFSPTKRGYALLTPDLSDLHTTIHGFQHNVPTQIVAISPTDANCFGEPFLRETVFRLLGLAGGPDVVMMNWILAISNGTGFIYSPRSDETVDLSEYSILNVRNNHHGGPGGAAAAADHFSNSPAAAITLLWDSKLWRKVFRPWTSKFRTAVKTCLIYFISTNLVSFLLRVAQERLLELSLQIRSHQQENRSIIPLFVTHVADCFVFIPITVGVLLYLREFYHQDWVISLTIFGVIFICELFSFVSIRTAQGIFFFPRAFFLLFCLVHFYLFSFPFGFSYVAMAMIVCFMLQCVTFFWNRYEVPAVALGRIPIDHRSRVDYSSSVGAENAVAVQQRGGVQRRRSEMSASNRRAQSPPRRVSEPIIRVSLQPQYQPHPTIHYTYSQGTFSQGTFSQGRMSRGSSEAIFQRSGDADVDPDEDDESESCLYFLGGEVVIRRGDENRVNNGNNTSSSDSGHSGADSNQMNRYDSSSTLQSGSAIAQLGTITDEAATSGLQAIHDLTPRLCNLSRNPNASSSGAPIFPVLDSSSTRRRHHQRRHDHE